MKIEYSSRDDRYEAALSEDSDWRLFNGIADAVLRTFRGTLVLRADGLDERYWDILIGKSVVTLYLQHYLGISLYAGGDGAEDSIRKIGRYLEGIEPKPIWLEWFFVKNVFRIRRFFR